MAAPLIQPAFAGGEFAPSMFARVDYPKYHIGLSTCRNGFINMRGGYYSRAGTALCGYSKQTGRTVPPRLITFQFSNNQGRALEFGNLYMRLLVDGAFVTEDPQDITGITQANPGVVTSVGHRYQNGDWVFLDNIRGMTELNGRTLTVANRTADTFTLTDVYGNAIDTTAYGAYVSDGVVARIYTLDTPWAEADLPWLKWTQSADTVSICCWNQQTGTEYAPYDLVRNADDDWTLTALTIGVNIDPPTDVSGNATDTTGSNPTDYQYVITATARDTAEESRASAIIDIPDSVDIAITSGSEELQWDPVTNAAYYTIYKAPPAYNSSVPPGSLFGYCGTVYGTTFTDSNIIADYSQVPPLHRDPFAPGAILSVPISDAGNSLTAVSWVVNTATGSGFNGYPILVDGTMPAFVVTDGGRDYKSTDTITFSGGTYAHGSIQFVPELPPTNGDQITLNGIVWTFVVGTPVGNQTQIGGSLATTIYNLALNLNASVDPSLNVARYASGNSGTRLDITYLTVGAAGNAYTLASGFTWAIPSGSTLTGGDDVVGTAPVGALIVGPRTGTYPSGVAYFQERRVYASTPNNPDTYWMSQPGLFKNFDSRIPTIASDALTGTPWSVQVNGIQAMVSMPGGLVVLTGLEAWQLTGAGGSSLNPQPITPASQQAQPQAYNGISSTVPPIKIDYDINYVQAKGSIWRDLSYNFWANIYTGADITYLSPHLFQGYTVREAAWCEEPFRLIWSARSDGALLSLTYFKQEEVLAWARHDTYGQVWSVCSVTEPPIDALYLCAERPLPAGNAYLIERMNNRLWAANENSWCVDSGLTTTLRVPNATMTASQSTGSGNPSGIADLVGGSGYSSLTTARIEDPTGSDAVVTLTIADGVITNATVAHGHDYSRPVLVIEDPTQEGTGASGTVVLHNVGFFNTDRDVFSPGDIGKMIRMGGGKAIIIDFLGPRRVQANIVAPIVQVIPNSGGLPAAAVPGSWSFAPMISIISGLWHLAGATVTGVADGAPVTPRVVDANGDVTLDAAASLVTLGLAFTPQMQTLYLEAGNPTVQGQRKKLAAVTVRMDASGIAGIQVGSNQPDASTQSPVMVEPPWNTSPSNPMQTLQAPPNVNLPPYGTSIAPLYTGDIRGVIVGGFDKPGQIALQQTLPLPMNILAVIPEVLPGDTPQVSAGQQPEKKGVSWGPQQRRAA